MLTFDPELIWIRFCSTARSLGSLHAKGLGESNLNNSAYKREKPLQMGVSSM